MRTANLAIVFTDIQGFTERTGRQSYEENQRMLRIHEALLLPVFKAFEGRLVKTIGDAFMVVFQSPTKAVLCGIAIQDRLWEYNQRAPSVDQIQVRVAINQGEVREEKGDVFGEPVNIAARVEGETEAGEVVFTEAVYLSMNKAEVPAEDRGLRELKGISQPVRLYRVPVGYYRLEVQAAQSGAAPPGVVQGPPYGGLGLARAGKLPAVDLQGLSRPSPLSAAASLLEQARATASLLPEALALSSGKAWLERLRHPAALRPALAVLAGCLFAGSVGLVVARRGDPVERAVAEGQMKEAHQLVHDMPAGPGRTYDEGILAEGDGNYTEACNSFAAAARDGNHRAFRKLLQSLRSQRCAARAACARALGQLGDTSASSALRDVAAQKFPDEGDENGLAAFFACNSRRAAREALEALEAK